MANKNWTPRQLDAITASGGSLLVSAAAGSGKTAVLVERLIRLICDGENPIPADRLLVMTFSNAAALEMKQRVHARLSALIRENPADLHLQRQQALLAGAQISTIHSFCLELIRQNFQHLDISPDFAVAEQGELAILRKDCLRQCVERFYAEDETGAFSGLVELLSAGRDDSRLLETVIKVYDFARSHPFYLDWLKQREQMYASTAAPAQTVWGEVILGYAEDVLGYCRDATAEALALTEGDPALEKAYRDVFARDLEQLGGCLKAVEAGDWDRLVLLLRRFTFDPLRAVRGVQGSQSAKERAKALRDRVKGTVRELSERHLNALEEDFREDMADLAPKVSLLFSLVRAFDESFRKAKADRRRLDFSDLEHLALELLARPDGEGFRRTGIAGEIAGRYEAVMVDEYQDTNEVQDMIFTCVSRGQENLFMVGDVKQSIYSFRQAMPEIFLSKKERFFPYDRDLPRFPARIILEDNFRSRRQVTEGVNFLFGRLMSDTIGQVDYAGGELLRCGAAYPEQEGMEPELLLIDSGGGKENGDAAAPEAEAVADRIARLLESGFPAAGADGPRPAMPGDICVLLRSPKGRAQGYVQALARRGIPALAEQGGGYLETREVAAAVSLLQALDNPLLDVELVAALLSPLIGFTDDEVARIRLVGRGKPFFVALRRAADQGDGRAADFLALFEALRHAATELPADKLLLRLYDLTGAVAVVGAMPMGEQRVANLMLLTEYAARYHALGYKKLGGFVGFLGRLKEREGDLAPASGGGLEAGNAVRVLSIHRSKGLEFPVVILADTFRRFNRTDLYAPTLLHSRLGFACMRRDPETRTQFTTVPMQAIRLEAERSMLSEELRVLYVALTRAKEKLIVTGTAKHLTKKLEGAYAALQTGRLPHYAVRGAACPGDWLLMALLHHPGGKGLREMAGLSGVSALEDANPWDIRLWEAPSVEETAPAEETARTAPADPELTALVERRAGFVYPYLEQTAVPAKLGVSSVAKGRTDPAWRFAARPKFLGRTALTPAEKGNALHKFMQFADYRAAKSDLEKEILRMREQRFLTPVEADSLSRPRLKRFFSGGLARRIFAGEKVMRELGFTAECGRDLLGDFLEGVGETDTVVLQGVADCVFFEKDGAVLLDYKTDAVQDEEELARRYGGQLTLYRRILERSLEAPVKECLIYSFALGKEIRIE